MYNFFSQIKDFARRHSILITNFSYLSLVQVLNVIIPIVAYPYLIRILGKDIFGMVIFAQAISTYLVILVKFGFNISATKEISQFRDSILKLSEIVSTVLSIKFTLFFFALILVSLIILILPQSAGYEKLFYLSMWICLYDVVFPIWYFQGIEKMKYIGILTFIGRITFLGLIFIFVRSPGDYLYVPILNGIGALLTGISALIIVWRHGIYFILPTKSNLIKYFRESLPIFISNITQLYTKANRIIIGLFIGIPEVAIFDLAEKVVNLLKQPVYLIGQTIFPKSSKEKNKVFIINSLKFTLILELILIILILLTSSWIVRLLGGASLVGSVNILRILSLSVIPIVFNIFYLIHLLLPFGYAKQYTRTIIGSGITYGLGIFIMFIFKFWNLYYITILVILSEAYSTIVSYHYCRKLNILKA